MRRNRVYILILGLAGIVGIGLCRGQFLTAKPNQEPMGGTENVPTNYAFPKLKGVPDPDPIPIPKLKDEVPALPKAKEVPPAIQLPPLEIPEPKAKKAMPPLELEPLVPPVIDLKKPEVKPPVQDPVKPIGPSTEFQPSRSPRSDVPSKDNAQAWSHNRVVPCVSLETTGPEAIAHGQTVEYVILVKNVGQVAVTHVRVAEELPAGAKYVGAEPAGEVVAEKVVWMLGSLNPNEEKRIKVQVRPGNEGDFRTRPSVSYSASTQMVVKVTRPNITLTITGPNSAQVGEEVPLQIQVTNTGSGEATKVLIKAVLSDGLKHSEGKDIEALLNKLSPGESQTVTLKASAGFPGAHSCTLTAACEGSPRAAAKATVQIHQPKLTLSVTGPNKCMVRGEPVFTLEVANPGSSATQPIQLAAGFPEGLDFVSASDGGVYDAGTRTVNWNLGPAEAGTRRNLTVKARSTSAGNLAVRAVAQAGTKLNARAETVIAAEGVPALSFEVVNLDNPVEVGKDTTYEIRIVNTGTCPCTNVRLTAAMSENLVPGASTGPVPYKAVGQTLHFEAIPRLAVRADAVIKIKAKGTSPGDLRFKVQLQCDQFKQPIVKEEGTTFFMP